jgi:hypothetical protein
VVADDATVLSWLWKVLRDPEVKLAMLRTPDRKKRP